MPQAEIAAKLARVHDFCSRHRLDGLFLWKRNNFAWITAGRDNHVANFRPDGVAGILVADGKLTCLCDGIEAPRMRDEELAGSGIEVVEFDWWDEAAARRRIADVISGRRMAIDRETDFKGLSLEPLPPDFAQIRWALTPAEIERYREGGRRTALAIENACRLIQPGDTEHDIAAVLDEQVRRQGLKPVVNLVAADQRVERFRHPIPTAQPMHRYAMLVICAEHAGLIANCTRLVHFGALPAELARRHQAVCNVDAQVNLSTVPGRTLGELFAVIQSAYADNGFDGEWRKHHQGGSTGYDGREVFATPASTVAILPDQAFAWNPSIAGTKSEDTVLVRPGGVEVLTPHGRQWPTVEGRGTAGVLARCGILVR